MANRRLLLLIAPVIVFFFVAVSLYLGRDQLSRVTIPSFPGKHGSHITPSPSAHPPSQANTSPTPVLSSSILSPPALSSSADASQVLSSAATSNTALSETDASSTALPSPVADGAVLSADNITTYIDAIFEPKSTVLPRLECPSLNTTRYTSLQISSEADKTLKYFFALDLRNCLSLLPRLIGSLVEVVQFLGAQNCALSIVEGNSPDGTADVLAALKGSLEAIGATYYFQSSSIDPSDGDRIAKLAELRNLALQPLNDSSSRATEETTVIFMNDVAACSDDILELIWQRRGLDADMTCAMDWTYVGKDPTFYDVWVARGINGDSFFEIPPDGNWNSAWNLFWNAEDTRNRFHAQRPFQVFSCWNGAVSFTAKPILEDLRFRSVTAESGECPQGEPQLFCKDLWFHGYGKIAVIPTVNLEYSDEEAKMIKEAKGYTSNLVSNQDPADDKIEWQKNPPESVKCMPVWSNQYWQKWNETL